MALAERIGGAIISADSRQIYKELSIGSAKPTQADRTLVPHYLIDALPLTHPYSAGLFHEMATTAIDVSLGQQQSPLVVGGSTLYVDTLVKGLPTIPKVPSEIRQQVQDLFATKGLVGLTESLAKADPEMLTKIDPRNPQRLMRALEVMLATGQSWSSYWAMRVPFQYPTRLYILSPPRPLLYASINARVDQMIAAGLIEEARHVYHLARGNTDIQALRTLGYAETLLFLAHARSLDETIYLIKRNTRRYAKRQVTWYKRYSAAQWFETPEGLFDAVLRHYGLS